MEQFRILSENVINKQELAQMYFPDLTIRASVNKTPKVDEEMQAIDE